MPGLMIPRRRSRSEAVSLEDEDEVESDASSTGSKRARLSTDTAVRSRINGIHAYTNGASTASDDHEHQPGSIVRVKLKNFVTYTATEFHPGPSLNMVIGPNGTGKSTLVCAICLGLGWGAQHLGRAKELSEFVKYGAREAEIEIELKAGERQRGRNPIIKRHIKREGNKTTWFINGTSATHKQVQLLAKSFSIQVDNLCQFLPQDRVVEFAALSPVQLLDQTQRAAAPEHMIEDHELLKRLRSEQKKGRAEQSNVQDSLANLENRQRAQRLDYERMQEREAIKARVGALYKMKPVVMYRTFRTKAQELKAEKKAAENSLRQLEQEVQPAMQAANAKQEYQDQVGSVVTTRKKMVERHERRVDGFSKELEDLQTKIEDCENNKKAEKTGDHGRKNKLERTKREIISIKARMEETPPEFDAAMYNEKIRAESRTIRDIENRTQEVQDSMRNCRGEALKLNTQIQSKEEELTHLQSQAGQQLNKLRQASRDTFKLWEYVQDNPVKFQSEVYGPPAVVCTLKDQRFADAIESMIQPGELKAFTCTSQADFQHLTNVATKQFGLTDFCLRQIHVGLDHFKPPASDEEMRKFGLDSWLLDHVQGPEPVLSMLCDTMRIHQTGLATCGLSDQQFQTLSLSAVSSFVDRYKAYHITRRREYGPKATSTRVRDVRPAKIWTNQRGNSHREDELRRDIIEAKGEKQELQSEHERLKKELESLKGQVEEAKSEKTRLEDEKATLQTADSEFKNLPTKLERQETQLAELQEQGAELKARLLTIDREVEEYAFQRGDKAIEFARAVDVLRTQVSDLITAELIKLEAAADLETLKARNADIENLLRERRAEVNDKEAASKRATDDAKTWMTKCRPLIDAERTAEEEQAMQDTERMSPQDLDLEIESAQSRLNLLHEGNPRAIQDFEKRAQDIERLKEKVQSSADALAELEQRIQEVRARWEPELDELVAKISDAFAKSFEKIGCAGQVGVHKDEDFENWAVQIMVRFRENETLTQLDSHRQSGGERAVSTIFYLMALQSLARAPFRVVDEINQGMDPRNERIVHERMVDIACGAVPAPTAAPVGGLGRSQTAELYGTGDSEDDEVDSVLGPHSDLGRGTSAGLDGDAQGESVARTSQYFLITPKLLSGLKYRPGMKVHCIASGEYMPEDWKKLDFGKMLAHAKLVVGRNKPNSRPRSLGSRVGSVSA
ncbi:putative ABC/SMC5 protein [Viridothelium virens]|uniref:Structural maintenance of chromosomes protein 5 n=1 Tax=Viridothelium virens TaxID=1048519 RepID=A0A6A6HJ61_VIRVR|nr:putative ABC/SMC5 protein [Viridothelium virens]